MLRVNQLSGFGGQSFAGVLVSTGSDSNTNNPSFTVDLGPPGVKQVLCAFACNDVSGSTVWTWGTGSVGGEAFTYVRAGNRENSGDGGVFTGGATVRALSTSLSGLQTATISMSWGAVMNSTIMLALVVRGVNPTAIDYDGGDNQAGSGPGNDFTISTAGARVVIGAAASSGGPGNFQGPGTEVTALASGALSVGYDLAPTGGAADVYSFSGASKYVISGASFG